MTDALQQTPPPPRAAAIAVAVGTPRTPTTPSSRRKSPLVGGNGVEQTKRQTPKQNGRGEGSGRGGAARSLLRGAAAVVLLMLAGIMASEVNLRLSRTGVRMHDGLGMVAAACQPASYMDRSQHLPHVWHMAPHMPCHMLVSQVC